jgi:hypothetical protein
VSTADSPIHESSRLNITPDKIAAAVGSTDRLETLELLAKIAGCKAALSDADYTEFRGHPLYAALEEAGDSDKLDSAHERGVKAPFRYLVVKSLVALRGGKQLPPTVGWPGMINCAKQMIAAERKKAQRREQVSDETSEEQTVPANGRSSEHGTAADRRHEKGPKQPHRGGKRDRKRAAAGTN